MDIKMKPRGPGLSNLIATVCGIEIYGDPAVTPEIFWVIPAKDEHEVEAMRRIMGDRLISVERYLSDTANSH